MKISATTRTQVIVQAISIAAIVLLVYWQALKLPFIQDDFGFLRSFQQNNLTTYATLKSFFDVNNFYINKEIFFRPLGQTYLFLMYELVGDSPTVFHMAALAIHTLNAWLVGLIFFALTRDRVISYCVAAIYAAAVSVHLDPLAWAVGIFDLGGAFFFLLSMKLFVDRRIAWSGIACFIGCLFKESVIVLPAILLLHELLLANQKSNWREWVVERWAGAGLFVLLIGLVCAIKIYQVASISLPSSHPYAISSSGVVSNAARYLKWMLQSFFPIGDRSMSLAATLLSMVAVLFSVIAAWSSGKNGSEGRRHSFLLGWLFIGLLPVIFFPNHTFRYYATYSLPAYIGLVLMLADSVMRRLAAKAATVRLSLMAICLVAVAFSVRQGNQIYREGMAEETFADGSVMLISQARVVDIVHDGLKKNIPVMPGNAILGIAGVNLWSFDKNSGPRFWYDDKDVRVYSLDNVKVENGKLFVDSPAEHQVDAYIGSAAKKVFIDPSRFFAFELVNEDLVRIYPLGLSPG
jgi:predicted membrane-bound dolichyl-phosphate-mannose-protein mannosyltransferase